MSSLDARGLDRLRASANEPGPGDTVDDRFEIEELIGEGGMGVVWKARDRSTSQLVALKVLRDASESARERFVREALALQQLSHPAIVRIIAAGTRGSVPFIAMELLDGATLAATLARGALPIADAIAIVRRIAEALVVVHGAGLVHRDLKPSNVFLVKGDPLDARLLDFGLSRRPEELPVTRTGQAVGTPGYMAPEQIRANAPVEPAADIFSLGCILFECVAGRAAFSGDSTQAVLSRILLEEPAPVRDACAQAPAALEELIARMLHKSEAQRPSADQVQRDLASLQALAGEAPRPADALGAGISVGSILAGRYKVEGMLGQGGMGIVVVARHLELGKRVAIKLLRGAGNEADETRFLREARAASRLESEHVARVLDVGRLDSGAPFMVMEHLTGEDLSRKLKSAGRLGIQEAVDLVLQACSALEEAHGLGIIHRDIKPSNLFLCTRRDGTPTLKVLDFGISKLTRALEDLTGESTSMTGTASVMGSAWYMSPEQLQDTRRVDVRTDIWSLGVVLYELVSGSSPFQGDNAAAVGARIAAGRPRKLSELRDDLPSGLDNVVMRCLEKSPDDRFSEIGSLSRALRPFGSAASQAPTVGQAASDIKGPSQSRTWWWFAALVGLGMVALVAVKLSAGSQAVQGAATVATPAAASMPEPASPEAAVALSASAPPAASASASVAPAAAPTPRLASTAKTGPASSAAPAAPPPKGKRELDLQDPALLGR
ncbi:MAG: serine/threonine protein kinase [Deltaproteobacteria bacterium]|nr:serine/threonine protein kinase [Deltaproteobacteria bacterium]